MASLKATIVLDPGHGGNVEIGGSSHNNARSPSGVLEKNITLRLAFLVREALREEASLGNHDLTILMTREADVNLGLADRAMVAKKNGADAFVSIHCNASESHKARGVETLVSPKAKNSNHADDVALARRVQEGVFGAVTSHDAGTKDRGVKDQPLGVLNEASLGTKTRGCLVEVEFIDRADVDALLNVGPDATEVRGDIAHAIARAVVDDLKAHA
jgi:N-acetylmuramoyl-L-alanine amidase